MMLVKALSLVVVATTLIALTRGVRIADGAAAAADEAQAPHFQTGATVLVSDFRPCADSHLCECSVKVVSCKRLEINSTEFNRLQRPASSPSSASTPYLLQELTVYRSNLSVLEAFSFTELRSLQRLSLRFNAIRIVHPDALRGLFQLKTLDFRQNSLSYLPPDVFTDLVQLEELDLSENNINTIDSFVLRPLLRLRKLSLASNDLKTILAAQNLPRLPSLEILSLADNDLAEITGETFGPTLPELRRLDLSGNRIQFAATSGFINMPRLEAIDLYANSLSYLDPITFQSLRNLDEILLGENPLVCDCKLQPLRLFYQQIVSMNPDNMRDRDLMAPSVFSRAPSSVSCEDSHTCSPICASPFYLKGHSFFDLAPSELACTTTTTTTTTSTSTTSTNKVSSAYLGLFGENSRVGGMLIASGKSNRFDQVSTPKVPAAMMPSAFDESLAIAIGIIASVLLLTVLVVGTLCFRHYFHHRRGVNHAKHMSTLSTGQASSTSGTDEAGDQPTTSSSSHSSSPGIQQNLPQQKHLSLSVTSGLNSTHSARFPVSSVSFDAFGKQSLRQAKASDYALYPTTFCPTSALPMGAENFYRDPQFLTAEKDDSSTGLLLQTVLAAAANHQRVTIHNGGPSILTSSISSNSDLRSFANVPRSESLV